jgi:chromosome partitioning protein
MRIISIANQKGGCGKTTTAINLSACLALQGQEVLLVDMDPQGHSGMGLHVDTNGVQKTVYEALVDPGEVSLNDVIIGVGDNLDIAPSDIALSGLEQCLSMVKGRETRLREAMEGLNKAYDYILIDCPPSLGLLTFNSLMASREMLIPIEMSLFSLHGTGKLLEILQEIRSRTNHEVWVKVIATMYDRRTRIAAEVLEDIREHFRDSLFKTVIHANVKLKEAASFGKSVAEYARGAQGFKDYMALAKEVMAEERILGTEGPAIEHRPSLEAAKIERRFLFHAPKAEKVRIVGDFNNWTPTDDYMMERGEDGTWSKTIVLKQGDYEYKFLVDDTWVEDKHNPKSVGNPFGGKNSILEVR